MDQLVARDIEACGLCPHLIFPGDEVSKDGEELIHADHVSSVDFAPVLTYT